MTSGIEPAEIPSNSGLLSRIGANTSPSGKWFTKGWFERGFIEHILR
jgi:hypothetical protein